MPNRPTPRLVHLGLGNFFRSHAAAFTQDADPEGAFRFAAFAGRSGGIADDLAASAGRYHLLERGPDGDRVALNDAIGEVHHGEDRQALDRLVADPLVRAVSLTVTEAGYRCDANGRLQREDPAVAADLAELGASRTLPTAELGPLRTAPGRLVGALAARSRSDAGPISLIPLDNLDDNRAVLQQVITEFGDAIDARFTAWLQEHVSVVGTVVDRITPRATADDIATLASTSGIEDPNLVVTEPFREWVLSALPAGVPDWTAAGAGVDPDLVPFERRKLWLLNGAHTILAWTGPPTGAVTVADAIAQPTCSTLVHSWWRTCRRHLLAAGASGTDLDRYEALLLVRFANPRLPHRLAQIAVDTSLKVPVRLVPVLRAERDAGRLPVAAVGVLASWIGSLRAASATTATGTDALPSDAGAAALQRAVLGQDLVGAIRGVLGVVDPSKDLADDTELVRSIASAC